MAKAAERLRRQ